VIILQSHHLSQQESTPVIVLEGLQVTRQGQEGLGIKNADSPVQGYNNN
jgi:hypothetical protein